jgi:hypothetical protein
LSLPDLSKHYSGYSQSELFLGKFDIKAASASLVRPLHSHSFGFKETTYSQIQLYNETLFLFLVHYITRDRGRPIPYTSYD